MVVKQTVTPSFIYKFSTIMYRTCGMFVGIGRRNVCEIKNRSHCVEEDAGCAVGFPK